MPDRYTHSYIATQALSRSGQVVFSRTAFSAGANGPDPLYAFQPWRREKNPNLPALAQRMHTESTGQFLNTLVRLAVTPVQQSYVLGFLTHYAADCTVRPYVEAMCRPGQPYAGGVQAHSRMQASLDSTLYYQEYRTYLVPLHAGTPVLITEELAQVVSLLHDAILDVYGVDIKATALADSFHNNLTQRKILISRSGVKKVLVSLVERVVYSGKDAKGKLRSRMQPAPPLKKLPVQWVHPYTGEERDQTTDELLLEAREVGAVYIAAAMQFWLGDIDAEHLARVLGNMNYYTALDSSLPDARVAEEAAGEEEGKKHKNASAAVSAANAVSSPATKEAARAAMATGNMRAIKTKGRPATVQEMSRKQEESAEEEEIVYVLPQREEEPAKKKPAAKSAAAPQPKAEEKVVEETKPVEEEPVQAAPPAPQPAAKAADPAQQEAEEEEEEAAETLNENIEDEIEALFAQVEADNLAKTSKAKKPKNPTAARTSTAKTAAPAKRASTKKVPAAKKAATAKKSTAKKADPKAADAEKSETSANE